MDLKTILAPKRMIQRVLAMKQFAVGYRPTVRSRPTPTLSQPRRTSDRTPLGLCQCGLDSGNVHCHWNIGGVENHGWIEEKCDYDLCICMLECISDNYKIASQKEATHYCYINNLWVQNGEDGNIFDYDFWKEHYLEQKKINNK